MKDCYDLIEKILHGITYEFMKKKYLYAASYIIALTYS